MVKKKAAAKKPAAMIAGAKTANPANKSVNKRGKGRPTKYKESYNELAFNYCLLGATDEELGVFFDVDEATVNRWKVDHKDFCASIKKGKEIADATVASKLFHRATGYEHPDTDIKMFEGEIIQTPLTKYYPPDTTAAIFWLKNRQPKKWRDKQEIGVTDDENKTVPLVTIFQLPDNGRGRV